MSRMIVGRGLLGLVMLALTAGAVPSAQAEEAPLSVESAPLAERDAALLLHAELSRALGEGAPLHPRLVRRFLQGEGWRYLVLVEDIPDAEEASRVAGLAEGLRVIAPPASPPPAEAVTAGAAPDRTREDAVEAVRQQRLPSAEGVLHAAVKAHGGRDGASARLQAAQSIRFRYQRRVPGAVSGDGALVAENEFLRSGDALRLTVTIEEGEGTDSVTTLTPTQEGWVVVGEEAVSRDGARTLEVLERFSPESVLAIPLGLPEDVETAAAWRGLQTVGQRDGVWVLRGELGEDEIGLVEAGFDATTRRLSWVVWSAERGAVTFRYGEYREVAEGLVAPFDVVIERDGELIEEIRVSELSLGPPLDGGLFAGPGGG